MSKEERLAQSRRASSASAISRRAKAEGRHPSGIRPDIDLVDVVEVCADALQAELDFPAGAPDWSARLTACAVLVSAFPSHYRSSPVRVRELLEELLPEHVYDADRMEAQKVYSAMRREWDQLVYWHPLRGLFVKPYPAYMIAAWESESAVQRERPAPIPVDDPRVKQLPDGRAIFSRGDAKLPVMLEQEPDEDGSFLRA